MIIAEVNGYQITEDNYRFELARVMKQMQLQDANQDCRERAVEHLIDGVLLLNRAREAKIEISADEIQEKVLDLMMDYETEDDFNTMLDETGLDQDTMRERLRDRLMVSRYVKSNICVCVEDVPEEKLRDFYEKNKNQFKTREVVRASHVLIKDANDVAVQVYKEIMDEIESPEDFGAIAKILSDCPSFRQSGDLGYFPRGVMVKEIEDAAFSMKVGEISDPIKTQFGTHILMLTDYKESHIADFEDIKGALKQRLVQIESELQLIRHIKQLRAEADIRIYDENL